MLSNSMSAGLGCESDTSDQDFHDSGVPLIDHQVVTVAQAVSGNGEPEAKRQRLDSEIELNMDQSVKKLLFNINTAICLRLDAMESKLDMLCTRTRNLEDQIDDLCDATRHNDTSSLPSPIIANHKKEPNLSPDCKKNAVVVGVPNGEREADLNSQGIGPNITLITLNNEDDFPNGSWLGDDGNPEMRVRVPVTPSDLLHIHSNCRSAEKMALTLLDYLFDRDTQANSNLSGMGKHGKKQLDPLMIYGIRCHLISKFGINEQDWHRIKQNIDSKCRTAFRRKQRGLPLTVKAFRGKAPPTYVQKYSGMGLLHSQDLSGQSDNSLSDTSELQIHQGDVDMQPSIIHGHGAPDITQLGEIQVLHATPEQIAQLHQGQQIQILHGENNTQIIQLAHPSGQTFTAQSIQPNVTTNVQVSEIGMSAATSSALSESETITVKNDTLTAQDILDHGVTGTAS